MRSMAYSAFFSLFFAVLTVADVIGGGNYEERNGIIYEVFEDRQLGTQMKIVKNSGICETTPNVTQYSGYFTVGTNMNMFFWFFEARNNPTTAPFSIWLNGGPGCSSMIGLFQENGPCQFSGNDTEPHLNPYSFNQFANMLYVDQPIGVGFSYGTDTVNSTVNAAPFVWSLLQAFFTQYPQYQSRDFGLFTESYGGHYGPEFAYHIEQQNQGIQNGTVSGQKINLVALGINNGFFDAAIVYQSYIDYAYQNSYKQIINKAQRNSLTTNYQKYCLPATQRCNSTTERSQNNACENAEDVCTTYISQPIENSKNFDVYDVREPSHDPYPPTNYIAYLNRADVKQAIGANRNVTFKQCSSAADTLFEYTGDEDRPFIPTLSQVVQSGVQTLIWAGDADFICNYKGGFATVNAINYPQQTAFQNLKLKPFYTNGNQTGLYKTLGNLSWLQVFAAGHEVPYYQPATALQVFKQTLSKQAISST